MTEEETSAVLWGRTTIEYGIRRSARRTTVAIAVDPVDGVMLTVPLGVGVAKLDQVVRAKAQWIVEHLRLVADTDQAAEPKQFVTGESFAYLGRNYRLRIVNAKEPMEAKLAGDWLEVGLPRQLPANAKSQQAKLALRAWYLTHAQSRLEARVEFWSGAAGVEVAGVRVRDQQKRWASCDDKGVLRFNWRIIQAPMSLVDYVVAHEVVHVIHRDHTKGYWARLGAVMPDYERRKEALRRLGGRLEW